MKSKSEKLKTILIYALVAVVAFFAFFSLKTWVISNYSVMQKSMQPTLKEGDVVWANKIKEPDYGDVVLVKISQQEQDILIKRVVAFGGDLVWVEQYQDNYGAYYLCRQKQGTTIEERLVGEQYDGVLLDAMNIENLPKDQAEFKAIGKDHAILVPEGTLYCLGDNRNNSLDSTELGAFDEQNLVGVVVAKGMGIFWCVVGVVGLALLVTLFFMLKEIASRKKVDDISDMFSEEEKAELRSEDEDAKE